MHWRHERASRKLLTLSYGAPSAFSDAHERAMAMRNRLLTDGTLCNRSLGLQASGKTKTQWRFERRCVNRAVADDLRRRPLSMQPGEGNISISSARAAKVLAHVFDHGGLM